MRTTRAARHGRRGRETRAIAARRAACGDRCGYLAEEAQALCGGRGGNHGLVAAGCHRRVRGRGRRQAAGCLHARVQLAAASFQRHPLRAATALRRGSCADHPHPMGSAACGGPASVTYRVREIIDPEDSRKYGDQEAPCPLGQPQPLRLRNRLTVRPEMPPARAETASAMRTTAAYPPQPTSKAPNSASS